MQPQRPVTDFKQNKTKPHGRSFKRIIQAIDNFGCPVQLLVKKKEKHQTLYGGCFTLLITLVAIFYLFALMFELVNKSNPLTLMSDYYSEQPEKVVLSPDKFTLAFAMEDAYTFQTYQNRSLFDVSIKTCMKVMAIDPITQKSYPNITCRDLPIESCDITKHFKIDQLKKYYQKQDLSTLFCMEEQSWINDPPVLEGAFDADIFQWLQISVNTCLIQFYSSCAPQEVIDSQLSAGYTAVYFSDVINDPRQTGDPYSSVGRDVFSTFSNSLSKEINIFMRHVSTDSDDGYILSDIHDHEQLQYSYTQELLDTRKSGNFLNIIFRLEQKKTVTYRSYKKLQDILGAVGGFWQVLVVIGFVLVSPINKLDLQIKILNKVFTFEVEQSQENQEDIKIDSKINLDSSRNRSKQKEKTGQGAAKILQSNAESNNLNLSTPMSSHKMDSYHNNEINSNEYNGTLNNSARQNITKKVYTQIKEKMASRDFGRSIQSQQKMQKQQKFMTTLIKEYLKMSLGEIKLKTYEYMYYLFACVKGVKPKQDQMKFGLEKLNKQIDVLYLIKKLTELEKLKMLLLTPQQLILFDYLPKPCIPKQGDGQSIEDKYEMLLSQKEDNQMSFSTVIQGRKTNIQKASEAFIAYDQIQSKTVKTIIDEKLIKFLDQRIKRLFTMGLVEKADDNRSPKPSTFRINEQIQQSLKISNSPNDFYFEDEQIGSAKIEEFDENNRPINPDNLHNVQNNKN